MKTLAWLIASHSVLCVAQVSSAVTLSNGVRLRITATTTGSDAGNSLRTALSPASGNSFYRIFRDENGLAAFAYEIAVTRTPDGEQFRITARPAGDEFATRFPRADGGKPVPTLGGPRESGLLASGDRFSIEIPTNPGLFSNMVDTVEVRLNRGGGAAADNSIATSSAGIRFSRMRVYINQTLVSPAASGTVVAGRYAMFYIPGRGGYFFSTAPVEGRPFVAAGGVDRNRMQFTLENDTYECRTRAPILTASDRGEIWVYHDPLYKPAGNWTKNITAGESSQSSGQEFFLAASDSLQWWLP